MNEKQLCDALAAALLAENAQGIQSASLGSRLSEIFQRLRALKVPWSKLIALIGPIYDAIKQGGTFTEIMERILDIFFPTVPPVSALAAAKA